MILLFSSSDLTKIFYSSSSHGRLVILFAERYFRRPPSILKLYQQHLWRLDLSAFEYSSGYSPRKRYPSTASISMFYLSLVYHPPSQQRSCRQFRADHHVHSGESFQYDGSHSIPTPSDRGVNGYGESLYPLIPVFRDRK